MKKKLLTGIAAGLSVLTIATPTFAATVNTNSGTRKVSDTTYNTAKEAFAKADSSSKKAAAKSQLDAAKSAQTTAQKKVNDLNKQITTAKKEVDSIKPEVDLRTKWVNNDSSIKNTTEYKNLENAKSDVSNAQAKVTAKEKEITTAQKDVTDKENAYNKIDEKVKRGCLGFFEWIVSKYPNQKEDATQALNFIKNEYGEQKVLEAIEKEKKYTNGGACAFSLNSMKIAVDTLPEINKARANSKYVYDYKTYLEVINDNIDNYTEYENKLKELGYDTFEWDGVDKIAGNAYLKNVKLKELPVTHTAMAIAQLQTEIPVNFIYKGIRNDFDQEVLTSKVIDLDDEDQACDYANMLSKTFGTAYHRYDGTTWFSGYYATYNNYCGELNYGGRLYYNEDVMAKDVNNGISVANYTKEFYEYYNSLNPDTAKIELDAAKNALTTKQNELKTLKNNLTKAQDTLKTAQAKVDDLKSSAKLNAAKTNYNTAQNKLTSLQKQLETANKELTNAKNNVTAKQKAYDAIKAAPGFEASILKRITDKDYTYLNDYIDKMLASKVGWKNENGKWRYYSEKDGKYYTGWKYMGSVEGEKTPHWSYFGKDGYLYTGWHYMSKTEGEKTPHWSYFGPNGWLRTGWQTMGTKQNPDGKNKQHMSYFGNNGWLRTGWIQLGKGTSEPDGNSNKHWSYFGSNGWLRTGWVQLGKGTNEPDGNKAKHWSYFGNNGWLRTGLQNMGKGTSNPDGNAAKHQSYFGDNGWLVTNKKFSVSGKSFTADNRGWLR